MSEGAGDGSGRATGLAPGALTALLQEVAAAPERREDEPLSLPPGTVIGRFEIIRELGRGSFGVVYEGKDRDLGRQVALKIVRPGRVKEEEGKVVREAEAIARLAHPNLITLHDVGRSDVGPYLVFEFLQGKTLQERMDDSPMPVQEAVHIATEVARGLAHAHAEGVIHRDLKPANVFVTNRGQVKVLDFGMAHAFGRRRLSGGTPAYMAPEQWEDAPEDERTDVFALGVMLYRMLTGEYPFLEGQGKWAAEGGVPRKLDVPGAPEVAELVEKMLDPVPTRRPRDGAAVLAAVTPIEEKLRAKPADGKPPEHAKRRKATFGDLLAELKRRHVFRVMVGYGIFSFAVLQVIEPIMHGAELPDWVLKAVLVALALGFPVAVILAWIFDLTAQGVKRTPSDSGPGAPSFGRARVLLPFAVSVAVLAIGAAGAGGWYAWKRASEHRAASAVPGATPSIAVLSFADVSPGKDQEYLSDGMAEEILNGLAQIEGLRVIGRTSSFSFKGKGKTVEEIGRELGVGAVLDGSVRALGNRFRITAQLVRVADGSHLWSKTYERELADLFAVQAEISRAVVDELKVKLLPGKAVSRGGGTTNAEALQQFLLGRDLGRSGAIGDAKRALAAFEKAVSLDPGFAQAWAGIATVAFRVEGGAGEGTSRVQRRRILEAADRAIALAPDLPDGYAIRSVIRAQLFLDWEGARSDVERAHALGPGSAFVAGRYGMFLASAGELTPAIAEFERAVRLDPQDVEVQGLLGDVLLAAGENERARAVIARAVELDPTGITVRSARFNALILSGQPEAALREARRTGVEWQRSWQEAMAQHELGHPLESQAALDELVRKNALDGAYQIGEVHAIRGEIDLAFEWLERARVQEDAGIIYLIKTDPYLKRIRCDPRFPALVEKLGLPRGGEVGCRPQAGSSGAPASPSIAVLPFADMSPKHDQEYFADGVAEEILNGLAQVRGLKVIGRTSSFSFKGKNDDLRAIGRKLNAGTILEGSVRKDGGRLRITAKLIRAEDGTQLWSQVFDRGQAGVFAVQEEIARAVASALRITVIPSITAPTVNPDAYNQYLLGKQFAQQGTVDGSRRALEAFRTAVRLDPTFAQAQARVADALRSLSGMDGERSLDKIRGAQRQALAEADRAVEMGPGVPDGYLVRAFIRNDVFLDWERGRADVEKARQLGPENAELLYHEAVVLSSAGQIAPAIDRLERAAVLDPLSPRIWAELGHLRLAVRQTDAAREAFRRSIEIAPDHFRANLGAALAELLAGNTPAALTLFQRNLLPWLRLMGSAMCMDKLGRRAEAQAALEQLIRDHGHNAAYEVAQVYAARSDREAAFDWLERAYRQRDASTAFLKFDPILDSLRGDPRYAALLRKVNLPVD